MIVDNAGGGTIAHMQPTTSRISSRFAKYLIGLRDHPTLGPPVRFCFRHREQLLYLLVGGWNTVFGYGVWAVMQYLLGDYVPYLVVLLLAWPIAMLNAYLGYRYVVFRSRGPVLQELPRFSLVYLVTLVGNLALLPVALKVTPFNIYVVQALFTALVVVCSYLGHKYFSFRRGHRRHPGDTSSHDPYLGARAPTSDLPPSTAPRPPATAPGCTPPSAICDRPGRNGVSSRQDECEGDTCPMVDRPRNRGKSTDETIAMTPPLMAIILPVSNEGEAAEVAAGRL